MPPKRSFRPDIVIEPLVARAVDAGFNRIIVGSSSTAQPAPPSASALTDPVRVRIPLEDAPASRVHSPAKIDRQASRAPERRVRLGA
jgi:hypothetical protein